MFIEVPTMRLLGATYQVANGRSSGLRGFIFHLGEIA